MDLLWNDERKGKFVGNVGLITTRGKKGDNIMAAEWTHQVSYSPGILSVSIGNGKISGKNIVESKEFGINLASVDQNVMASVAGGSHGDVINKIEVLKELGFKFSDAKKIKTLMVNGSALQAECKLIKKLDCGTHTTYFGEIVELYPISDKDPLIYTGKAYWHKGKKIEKPEQEFLDKIAELVKKHTKA